MIKLSSKRLSRSLSKLRGGGRNSNNGSATIGVKGCNIVCGEIKWEMRPGGMLVQKRECVDNIGEGDIVIKVTTVSKWHDISIQSTSTFGTTSSTCTYSRNFRFFFQIIHTLLYV